ncbi:MAG TPA: c-type cytochrome [Gammaproteobacteria bacterium]|nr:c-type cytochrome [Gammaproteobacteria bacterium]
MKPGTCLLATVISVGTGPVLAQAADERPQIEIANPNATFPAQQRALPSAEVIERGDGLYQVNCMACHGADLRGGDQGGPNLLRSTIVLNDVEGELIGEVVRSGMNRMPPSTTLDEAGIRAVAGYIHSVVARAERQGAPPLVEYDLDILVGDARRGERVFEQQCAQCHSAAGDLEGIAARIEDPVDLQNTWVAGRRQGRFGGGSSVTRTVTVTTVDGREVSGELVRYDDFFVALRTPAGEYRSFSRVDTAVGVEIDDPLRRHAELWAELDDATIHDVTAYLETLR